MAKRILLALLGIGLLATLAGVAGLALFTDSASVGSNTFSTSSIDIATSPTSALVTFSGMVPGDTVTNPLDVLNNGTLQFRYAISSVATNADTLALKDALTLTIKSGVTTCTTAGFGSSGTVIYTGDLDDGASGHLVGDPTQGSQAGDRVLNASTSETLCFQVQLPSAATGPQGATTTATFTFDAEQTVNNP
jgi:hypothetical protein